MFRETWVPFRKFIKRIPLGVRVLALLIMSGWLVLVGAESGAIWSALWLPLRDVPLDSRPSDKLSATRLALTIARAADCKNFELQDFYKDYAAFSCQTGSGGSNKFFFDLMVFYDRATRDKVISKFSQEGEWGKPILSKQGKGIELSTALKAGPFYLVTGGSFNKQLAATPFPGEIVYQTDKAQ